MELLLRVFQFLALICHWILYPILRKKKKKPPTPAITNYILTLSLKTVIGCLKSKNVTSRELVDAYIIRIREVNPYINAVVQDRFIEAQLESQHADKLINKCRAHQIRELFKKYPMLGVPFTVKEACGVLGMTHSVGSKKRENMISVVHCEPVKNLIHAGAIPLLVSANPEYCFSIDTNSLTNGRCLNPYNPANSSGGSSGGEGALNGCGASLFGIGSDIAGSIRIPCLVNGVFGHKPTGGLISNRGHFPNSDDRKCSNYLQMGPITRFGKDLDLILHVMAGARAHELDLFTPIVLQTVKIYYSSFYGINGLLHQSVSSGIQNSISSAVQYFKSLGVTTQEVEIKLLRNSTEIALASICCIENFPYATTNSYNPPTVTQNVTELLSSVLRLSNHTPETVMFDFMRATNVFMGANKLKKYEEEKDMLRTELVNLLGSDGVLFFPTLHDSVIHNGYSLIPQWGIDYCLLFNVLGLPSTHVCMGLDAENNPVGFQVVASPMHDKLCLNIAAEIEKGFGGWVPPSKNLF